MGGARGIQAKLAERKVSLAPQALKPALTALGVSDDDASKRRVWFLDTGTKSLETANVVVRARVKEGDEADLTVKIRPAALEKLRSAWAEEDGFEAELDLVGSRPMPSASLAVEVKPRALEAALEGKKSWSALLTDAQRALVREATGVELASVELVATEPAKVRVWKAPVDGFAGEVVLEHWRLPTKAQVLELSSEFATTEQLSSGEKLEGFTDAHGLTRAGSQVTKTAALLSTLSDG